MGSINASRPDDLPPSQGGKYQGFGSTPEPPAGSQHPSFGLTSAAAPSFADFQSNPTGALSKGWSLFSAAVAGASRAVSENVIQPGMEKVNDPEFQSSVRGYMTEAQKRAAMVGQSANSWSKNQFGVDVAEHVGGAYEGVRERVGGGPERNGYGSLSQSHDDEQTSALYHDDTDNFFTEYEHKDEDHHGASAAHSGSTSGVPPPVPKKDEDWDEWKDF